MSVKCREVRKFANILYICITLVIIIFGVHERWITTFDDVVTYPPIVFTQDVFDSNDAIRFISFASSTVGTNLGIGDQLVCLNHHNRWERIDFIPTKTIAVEPGDENHPANVVRQWQIDHNLKPYESNDEYTKFVREYAETLDIPSIKYTIAHIPFEGNTLCRMVIALNTDTPIFEFHKSVRLDSPIFGVNKI